MLQTETEEERPAAKKAAAKLGTFEVEGRCLVKPGRYDVMFLGYHTWMMFGRRAKICLKFRIVTPGDAFGKELNKHYNASKLKAPIGKNGSFKVGGTSRFFRDFVRLLGNVSGARLDRCPMSRFENNVFSVNVETIKLGNDGEGEYAIVESAQYSVIRDLIEVVEGANAAPLTPKLLPNPRPIPIPTKNGVSG